MKSKESEFNVKIGLRLKVLRQSRKLTQAQLSADVNIEISQISRIERGLINTSISNLHNITKALNITLEEFFSNGFEH
tara:strand:- start:229 stop:462 length:234 start_codon:yes stop_codon:yes gene_type:complete